MSDNNKNINQCVIKKYFINSKNTNFCSIFIYLLGRRLILFQRIRKFNPQRKLFKFFVNLLSFIFFFRHSHRSHDYSNFTTMCSRDLFNQPTGISTCLPQLKSMKSVYHLQYPCIDDILTSKVFDCSWNVILYYLFKNLPATHDFRSTLPITSLSSLYIICVNTSCTYPVEHTLMICIFVCVLNPNSLKYK